jgi:hypothetical protein
MFKSLLSRYSLISIFFLTIYTELKGEDLAIFLVNGKKVKGFRLFSKSAHQTNFGFFSCLLDVTDVVRPLLGLLV